MAVRTAQGRQHSRRDNVEKIPSRRPAPAHLAMSIRALIASGIVFGLVVLWASASTGYILFRDEFLAGMVHRQTQMQYDYEERIAALRAEVARVQSRQLLDQTAFSETVSSLMRRQSSLEQRQIVLQSVADTATSSGIAPEANRTGGTLLPPPRPLPDLGSSSTPRPEGRAEIRIGPPRQGSVLGGMMTGSVRGRAPGVPERLDAISRSIDDIELKQMAALDAISLRARARSTQIREVLGDIGVDLGKLGAGQPEAAQGGPYIPIGQAGPASIFDTLSSEVRATLAVTEGLTRSLSLVPLRRPFLHAEVTSSFGSRSDPFLGSAAMHAGIDFREETGAPIRATAAGRVDEAGWTGGYGNMVEIDHGSGLATRYGHMSEILVSRGDLVEIGQILGRVGSTGRSTGPHLHYETRVRGEAVDPQRFLRAGRLLGLAPL
jgi:murein DD-endopeptidase MepM/ murein hydrolase activator NlpD